MSLYIPKAEIERFSLREQAYRHPEFTKKTEGKLIRTPDLALAQAVILEPYQTAKVPLLIPFWQLFEHVSPVIFTRVSVNTRSKCGQLGVVLERNAGKTIEETYAVIAKPSNSGTVEQTGLGYAQLRNYAAKPVLLPAGFHPGHFEINRAKSITGLDLKDTVNARDGRPDSLNIKGEYAWDYRHNSAKTDENIWGVRLPLSQLLRWIPPYRTGQEIKPISVPDQTTSRTHGRHAIYPLTEVAPVTTDSILVLRWTPKIEVGQGLDLELMPWVYRDAISFEMSSCKQINSVSVKDGSKHRVVAEIFGPTASQENQWVVARVYRHERTSAHDRLFLPSRLPVDKYHLLPV